MKALFNVKALHLGHLAKSYALRDAPGEQQPTKSKKRSAAGKAARQQSPPRSKRTFKERLTDEFGSGADDSLAKRSKRK